jgi:hypothetical protein
MFADDPVMTLICSGNHTKDIDGESFGNANINVFNRKLPRIGYISLRTGLCFIGIEEVNLSTFGKGFKLTQAPTFMSEKLRARCSS